MDTEYMIKKYLQTDDDIVISAIKKMPEDFQQEYQDLEREISSCRSTIHAALVRAGETDALQLLDRYEGALTVSGEILWQTMFLAGAEVMEHECAEKMWKTLERVLQ